ncbi:MAG: SDR family oxidoreductase [Candidatus Eremiobacteraeota bacterium]|nr:SDR family oxidoreductase [Candidatus Eremiobacteraeota bacterium]
MSQRRRVLVTGAARGLARGIVVDLARAGYRVAFTFRASGTPPDDTLAAARERGGAGGADVIAIEADHERSGATERSVRAAQQKLGGVDAFVHAVGPMVIRRFATSTPEDYRAMITGNLESAVEGAFAALPGMRERSFGRLIFFGMNGSHVTWPSRGLALYAAAKAGVVAFARTLALEEAARGITVNVVEPGDIRNKDVDRPGSLGIMAKNPTGHAGSWEDVAYAVRFLLSDEASFMNGVTIGVNGGLAEPHE